VRAAVIGATGQLGTDLCDTLQEAGSYELRALGHRDVEVTSAESLYQALQPFRPDVVINCAAFHRVDDCESDIDKAFTVNALGSLNTARVAEEVGALCVLISTDYVFDGEKEMPYRESDPAHPINAYGVSKLSGEHLLEQNCSRWMVARVSSLFGKAGSSGKGGNFIETILSKASTGQRLTVVDDIRMSPTYCRDAAKTLERLISGEGHGVYHLANHGATSWYDFACKALQLTGSVASVEPTSAASSTTKARRPKNSSLTTERSGGDGVPSMPPWTDALRRYLAEKGHL
jgi:dTDP-4-dehydrorhamnose reductase